MKSWRRNRLFCATLHFMTNILTICNYKIYFIISFFFLSIFDTSHSQFHCIVLLVVGEYITYMTILTYIIMEPPVLAWCRSASTKHNSCIPCKCTVDIYLSLHISILLTQENSTPWRGAVFPYFTICSACCTPFVPYSLAKHTLYRHPCRASVPCRDRSVQALFQYPRRDKSAQALYQHPRQNNACHDSRKRRE